MENNQAIVILLQKASGPGGTIEAGGHYKCSEEEADHLVNTRQATRFEAETASVAPPETKVTRRRPKKAPKK